MKYDFSKGDRGKFHHPDQKLNLPIYLDEEQEEQSMGNTAVEDVMNILSEEERQEVLDFALFLAERKRTGTSAPTLRFPWAGALEDISPKPTSVDLQHEVVREWGK